MKEGRTKVCMIVPDSMVKGGIAAVVNGYRGSKLEKDYDVIYVESYKDGSKLAKLFKGIRGYFHFAKVLLWDKPDIVHIHSSFGPSFYRKLPFIYMASWAEKPVINHIHGADFDEFYVNAGENKKQLIKKVYSKCSVLIALSEEWKLRLSDIVPKEKITIIENYSILHENALTQRLQRKCGNNVLFLGELGKRKGCYDIPLVAQKVKEKIPNVKFILAGAGTSEDEMKIKEMFSDRLLSENVVFPGWVRDKEKDKLLCDADVFFLPSYNEGMPMSVLDAMGYGLPIVSTNVGGIPKIVKNEVNGYCCNCGDADSLSDGIINILSDKEQREKFAKGSISIVKNGYSIDLHISALEKLYEEVSC